MKSFAGSVGVVLLGGCVASAPILARNASPPAGEAAVSGRIYLWDRDKLVPGSSQFYRLSVASQLTLVLVSEANGKVFTHRVVDGQLSWHLPAGRYSITAFSKVQDGGVRGEGLVGASFEVPPAAKEVCIGALNLALGSGRAGVTVEDDCEVSGPASQEDASRVRSPLRLDDDPHGLTIDPTLSGKRSGSFGRDFFVAQPVTPAIRHTTESLQPTLRWEPLAEGGTEGITYDLRIHRVVAETWGPLVVARDGLETPSYQVEKPLQPGAKYYWRVRLRRGERVSSWSWYDSSLSLLFGWTVGAPFYFFTPD